MKEMQKIPYASTIGSLMCIHLCIHPNLAFIIGMLVKYLSIPGMDHWNATERVMQYLKRTKDYIFTYRKSDQLEIVGYFDFDFAGCQASKRDLHWAIFICWQRHYFLEEC